MIGPLENKTQCKNIADYMMTSFFRFMILLSKSTQHITSKTYNLVPILDFEESWTDEKLFKIQYRQIANEFINSLNKE